jgi:hypothetical protein
MSQPNEQQLAEWKAYLERLRHYVPKLEAYLETGEGEPDGTDSETPKPPRPPLPPNG